MAKKQFYMVIDCESTIKDHCADIACVIVDKTGKIYNQMAVLVNDFYGREKLFFDEKADNLWSLQGLARREENYARMLESGARQLASVASVNRWLDRAIQLYPQIKICAYNLAFDARILKNSGILLENFPDRFCLWSAFIGNFANGKEYKAFCLENHYFSNRTKKTGAITMRSNAECAAHFITSNFAEEPHDALGDVLGFEIPILVGILKKRGWRERLKPFNYQELQLRDNFRVK